MLSGLRALVRCAVLNFVPGCCERSNYRLKAALSAEGKVLTDQQQKFRLHRLLQKRLRTGGQ